MARSAVDEQDAFPGSDDESGMTASTTHRPRRVAPATQLCHHTHIAGKALSDREFTGGSGWIQHGSIDSPSGLHIAFHVGELCELWAPPGWRRARAPSHGDRRAQTAPISPPATAAAARRRTRVSVVRRSSPRFPADLPGCAGAGMPSPAIRVPRPGRRSPPVATPFPGATGNANLPLDPDGRCNVADEGLRWMRERLTA